MVLMVIGLTFIWFTRIHIKKASANQLRYFSMIEFALLIAYIPLLAFTSENAFIFTLPLVFVVILHFNYLKTYEKVLAVMGFLFIGGNFGELWGPIITQKIDDLSLISIGTLILIGLTYSLRIKNVLKAN
jgi:hypothetical protein